ncbi:MAG: hypothetical protein JWR47_3233 [Phenylobacterium sp.]|jgi:hypothetical protein|nr:hypothetical protein [Phenylobacterium sp.]MDB5426619.1 hypothetical protein [Phenylobacterium sp.]MDB5436976.1 hypothetical protein [Phenylobacterium sp.]MDB5497929.1 hypothetical protein [Phenylobacterium sp.]
MAVDRSAQRPPKTLAEGAVCLACTIGLLLAAAMIMQWVLHLVP